MKKILYSLIVATSIMLVEANLQAAKHFILNLSGQTVIINFYGKLPLSRKNSLVGTEILGPMALGGKSPKDFLDTITSSLLPKQIDMREFISNTITIDVLKVDSKNAKDPKYTGVNIPTPGIGALFPNDYKIELQGDQLVVTKLKTCSGIPKTGADETQWPSAEEMKLKNMSPQEKITYYENEIKDLEGQIRSLNEKIKKFRKQSKFVEMNNRKSMRSRKEKDLQNARKELEKAKAALASTQAPAHSSETQTQTA